MRTTLAPIFVLAALFWLNPEPMLAADAKPAWQLEWEKTVEAAKNEGKLVAALPASAELRKAITEIFPKRFPGIELDLTNARGPSNAGKIAAEFNAGVRYYDLLISGTSTPFNLLNAGILEPAEPLLILPEVKDPKRWFGGHIWLDNAKKFIYAFQVYQSENIWHNPTLMKAEEARSYDDLLQPKFKRQDRYPRPTQRRRRDCDLGILSKNQRRGMAEEARRARNVLIARSAPARRQSREGQSRHHDRSDLLHIFAVLEGQSAGQTAPRHERRHLRELRQQRNFNRQKFAASQRCQSVRQLAL